jgi:hypothetical protein
MSPDIKALHMAAYGYDYDHALDHALGLDVEGEEYTDEEFFRDWEDDWLRITEGEAV